MDGSICAIRRMQRVTHLSMSLTTWNITLLRPFARDNLGELVPEETPILINNHPLSASSIYYNHSVHL